MMHDVMMMQKEKQTNLIWGKPRDVTEIRIQTPTRALPSGLLADPSPSRPKFESQAEQIRPFILYFFLQFMFQIISSNL